MKKEAKKKLVVVTIFAIAFALVETIIVVYLRKIYYPSGFKFPLVESAQEIFYIELLRETATVIMLLTIAFLAGKKLPKNSHISYSASLSGTFSIIYG